jgi:hypothetical protein
MTSPRTLPRKPRPPRGIAQRGLLANPILLQVAPSAPRLNITATLRRLTVPIAAGVGLRLASSQTPHTVRCMKDLGVEREGMLEFVRRGQVFSPKPPRGACWSLPK